MVQSPARLYIGDLPYVAQKADIELLFEQNEIPVKNIDGSIDPFTGRNPSYCFVDLHDDLDVQKAVNIISGQYIRGRPVRLSSNTNRWNGKPRHAPTGTSVDVLVFDR